VRRTQTDASERTPAAFDSDADPFEISRFAVPLPPEGMVRRARLLARLDEGVRGPLTLVTAPAGTGKTVLVACWAAQARRVGTVVWISLDSGVGTGPFWRLVTAGLSRRGVDVPATVPTGPDAGDPSFTSAIAGRIVANKEPVVLVLDCDGALMGDVAARLDMLIRRSAGQLRVVLLTREDPLLPLHRYRLAESVVELRMADLAFTATEARELLIGTGVHLSGAAMDAVTTRTQGWAAGLRMAAMSLAHREDREEAARQLVGDTGTVAEYLLAEVLDTQPDGLRRLMLDTSVVDVLQPGLAAALAGPHAERALSFLVHGNAFLEELPELPRCYRYHLLFRELLRAQLAYESPARSVELHRVAASWLADHGQLAEAVRHAAATGDWDTAARFVVDDLAVALLMTAPTSDPLAEALTAMPTTATGAGGSIIAAARAAAAGDWQGVTVGVRRARRALAPTSVGPWPAAELALSLLELVRARRAGDADAALEAAAAAQALMDRQAPGPLAAHPELTTVLRANLGAALVLAGRLDAAAEALAGAAETGLVAGREHPVVDALGHRALLAALRGDLRASAALAGRVVRISSAAGLTPSCCPAAAEIALAYVHAETYDIGAARRHVARATACDAAPVDPLATAMRALVQARACRAAGDLEAAGTALAEAFAGGDLPAWLADRLVLEQVSLLVLDGRTEQAAALADQLSEQTSRHVAMERAGVVSTVGEDDDPAVVPLHRSGTSLAARVDTLLQEAAEHVTSGAVPRAVRELEHALRLAAPEQLRRPFREAPEELWRVLRSHDDLLLRHAWLTGKATGRPDDGLPQPRRADHLLAEPRRQIVEPLTDKEREVLGHLSELLTTGEIAAVMFISVNTVRTHVRNILRKLGASRRNEAVRRARDLRIVPDMRSSAGSPAPDEAGAT
jgi:LuxR family transcriptional regulator, maltose regulon positive regulatory protein